MPAKTNTAGERVPTARALGEAIQEDLGFQARSWRVQRFGWLLGVVLFVAAAVGLMGGGPFSTARATSGDGKLEATYDLFARHGHPTQISLRLDPGLISDGTATVWVRREYLDGLMIDRIIPQPSRVLDGEGRTGYEFEAGETGSEGLDVTFAMEYDDVFLRHGEFAPEGGSPVRYTQFVYP